MAPLCRALALCLTAFAGACASLPEDRPAVTTSARGSPARNERLAPSAPVDPGASPDVTSPTSVVEPASASPCSASGVEPRPRALALPHRLAGEATPVAPFEQLDAEALEGFPATSEDGTKMVEIGLDSEDFSGNSVERVRFRSLPSGRILATFTLYDQRELFHLGAGTELAALRKARRNWQLAEDALATSKWLPMRAGERSEEGCGAWASLGSDENVALVRFERPDIGVSLDPPTPGRPPSVSVLKLTTRGVERAHVGVTIPRAGHSLIEPRGTACGGAFELSAGFISQDGKTLRLRPENSVGGDSCMAELDMDTWLVTTVPPETIFAVERARAPEGSPPPSK